MSRFMFASDIHGSSYYCELLKKRWSEEKAEKLFLLGDLLYHGPRNDLPKDYAPKEVIAKLNEMKEVIVCVRGNCEAEVDQMVLEFPVMAEYTILYADGLEFFLTHGHIYNEENLPSLSEGAVFVQGHTHIPVLEKREHYIMLNPGSISIPKGESEHTYIIYENRCFYLKNMQGQILQTLDLNEKREKHDFTQLRGIVRRLHAPEGCPWDRVQTNQSLKGNTIEEAYEILEGVERLEKTGDFKNLQEELGDMLFLILLHSEIADCNGQFSIEDVVEQVARKMIHRHPKIFGGDVDKSWEQLKMEEHPHVGLEESLKGFPALMRSQKWVRMAEKSYGVHRSEDNIRSEMLTILTEEDVTEKQIGKLLLDTVELAQKYHFDAEVALNDLLKQAIQSCKAE